MLRLQCLPSIRNLLKSEHKHKNKKEHFPGLHDLVATRYLTLLQLQTYNRKVCDT